MSGNSFAVQLFRAVRATIHVFAGIFQTTVIFPRVSPAKRRARVKRWSEQLLRMLSVEVDMC